MKKLLTLTLSLLMAFTLCLTVSANGGEEGDGDSADTTGTVVAKIGDETYTSLQEAITDAKTNDTIQLIKSTTENITVASDKKIKLDIDNGVTLTNNGDHTIINNGTLTITGGGAVDNVTHQKAAIYNSYGATATLEGGVSYTRSQEAGIDKDNSGENSWYYIENHGTMTLREGVRVNSNGHFSSLIINGDKGNTSDNRASLTIENGNFSGGLNTVKNGSCGDVYINGGMFSNTTQATLLNFAYAEIKGGSFNPSGSAEDAILSGVWRDDDGSTEGKTVIKGGTFNGLFTQYYNEKYVNNVYPFTMEISGGTFTIDVTKYLVDGYNAVKNSEGVYTVVKKDSETKVDVNQDTTATPALEEKAYDETKTAVEELNKKIKEEGGDEITFDADTKVELVVEEIKGTTGTYTAEDETKVIEEAKTVITDTTDKEIKLVPLDVTLNVVNGTDKTPITSLTNAITVTLYLNDATLQAIKGKNPTVVRIHDGKYEALETTLKGNALSFETDRFSTYVIAYANTKAKETTPTKSYSAKDKNQDGVISCEEEMNSANWIWSESKKACVYKVSNTSVR